MAYTLPALSYPYDALEPSIDAETMRIHHTKHHQAYVDKLNGALARFPEFAAQSVEDLLGSLDRVPGDIRTLVRNHGGGHSNHSIFWNTMCPKGSSAPAELRGALESAFGSMETFQEQFTTSALNLFGSGWTWLVQRNGALDIVSRPNQDSPLLDGLTPLLGVDVWEHAYYLRYQNRRAEYLAAWWNVVNYEDVQARFQKARV